MSAIAINNNISWSLTLLLAYRRLFLNLRDFRYYKNRESVLIQSAKN